MYNNWYKSINPMEFQLVAMCANLANLPLTLLNKTFRNSKTTTDGFHAIVQLVAICIACKYVIPWMVYSYSNKEFSSLKIFLVDSSVLVLKCA